MVKANRTVPPKGFLHNPSTLFPSRRQPGFCFQEKTPGLARGGEEKQNEPPAMEANGVLYFIAFFILLSGFFTMSCYPERWVSG